MHGYLWTGFRKMTSSNENQIFKPEEYSGIYVDLPQKDSNLHAGLPGISVGDVKPFSPVCTRTLKCICPRFTLHWMDTMEKKLLAFPVTKNDLLRYVDASLWHI